MISLDLPFFLIRSLAKMADKVQMKAQYSETSLFHHGLVKLIVLHELQRINREWSTFFLCVDLGWKHKEQVLALGPNKNHHQKLVTLQRQDKNICQVKA